MTDEKLYPVSQEVAGRAFVNRQQYDEMYRQSIENPDAFWGEHGKRLDWIKPYTKVKNTTFDYDNLSVKWFEDGQLNASANCLDRHLEKRGNQTAIIFEGDDPADSRHVTYRELHRETCKFANVLKGMGVKKGDVVTIYMPMIVETAVVMLACARIGAIHSVVFAGFSPEALASRIKNGNSHHVITADEGLRGGRKIQLKKNVDAALKIDGAGGVQKVVVVTHTGSESIAWNDKIDVRYEDLMKNASEDCAPEPMNSTDPLFMLYTSGSTGAPKGVLHATGGYMTYVAMTHQYVFDYHEGDVYWCTADFGWVTGHSYILYGPLANGATTLLFEGVPNYPDISRMAQVVDKHKVNILYTAPTAIRALKAEGDAAVAGTTRSSLKLLGSVGEPINPEAWEWYHRVMGNGKCPVVDTWWQTENGGILITALPGAIDLKPGSATLPFFGVKPGLVDNEGNLLEGVAEGNLVILDSWPGQMVTIFGDHERFRQTYFSAYRGMYFSGDGARRDSDGYYWITGRVDDVLNVSGHRLGTAEVESALIAHNKVAEAAVVGYPHELKGQGIYVYVTLMQGEEPTDELKKELIQWVRKEIGPIATPDIIQWAVDLPKTRSGKIMRRILRKIAANEHDQLGDTSTLADPSVVDDLISGRAFK
ncbi:MAG TPA: acetate--CoA ligase [Marinobacter sp.]|nr:acetate--CoA ligase [Marinobacter sp.]